MIIDYPKKGEIYQHYKGQYYLVEGVGRHSETGEWYVVYRCLYHKNAVPTDEPGPGDEGIPFGQLNVRPMRGSAAYGQDWNGWADPVTVLTHTTEGTKQIARFSKVDLKVWP